MCAVPEFKLERELALIEKLPLAHEDMPGKEAHSLIADLVSRAASGRTYTERRAFARHIRTIGSGTHTISDAVTLCLAEKRR